MLTQSGYKVPYQLHCKLPALDEDADDDTLDTDEDPSELEFLSLLLATEALDLLEAARLAEERELITELNERLLRLSDELTDEEVIDDKLCDDAGAEHKVPVTVGFSATPVIVSP